MDHSIIMYLVDKKGTLSDPREKLRGRGVEQEVHPRTDRAPRMRLGEHTPLGTTSARKHPPSRARYTWETRENLHTSRTLATGPRVFVPLSPGFGFRRGRVRRRRCAVAFGACVSPSRRASRDRARACILAMARNAEIAAAAESPPETRRRRRPRPLRRPGRIPASADIARAAASRGQHAPSAGSTRSVLRVPTCITIFVPGDVPAGSFPHPTQRRRLRGALASGVARLARAGNASTARTTISRACRHVESTAMHRVCGVPERFASGGEFRRDAARERPPRRRRRRRRRRTRRHLCGRFERFGVGADVDTGDVRGVRGGVEEVDGRVGGEDAAVGVVVGVGGSQPSRRKASGGDLRVSTAHRRRHRGRIHPVARARLCSLGWVRMTSAPRVGKGVSGRFGHRHARAGRPQLSHVARRPETEGWSSASASLASRVVSQSAARSSSPSSSRVIVAGSTMRTDSGGRLERCAGCAGRRVGGCRCDGGFWCLAEHRSHRRVVVFAGELSHQRAARSFPRRPHRHSRDARERCDASSRRARARRRWRARRDATARVSPLRTTTSLTRLPRGR